MKNKLNRERSVFITGGTGYLGRHLIPGLLRTGVRMTALTRESSKSSLPEGCEVVVGNVLERITFQEQIPTGSTFIHLVGVSRPNPTKAEQFRKIDLKSVQEAVAAAKVANVAHFVYVSVAHPAPVMKVYWQIRGECESVITGSGLNATILRPWYILGPGHRWPLILTPFYKLFEKIPATAETSRRLGFVKLPQMISTLTQVVLDPIVGKRVLEVSDIRKLSHQ